MSEDGDHIRLKPSLEEFKEDADETHPTTTSCSTDKENIEPE
jgi:hypothetical protein